MMLKQADFVNELKMTNQQQPAMQIALTGSLKSQFNYIKKKKKKNVVGIEKEG